ncbi:hypothetical protein H311_00420 [Anncaliia algerae PRA109]|nr:hypothetical protein H311_00420 [Anncaliia algerae PRA109]
MNIFFLKIARCADQTCFANDSEISKLSIQESTPISLKECEEIDLKGSNFLDEYDEREKSVALRDKAPLCNADISEEEAISSDREFKMHLENKECKIYDPSESFLKNDDEEDIFSSIRDLYPEVCHKNSFSDSENNSIRRRKGSFTQEIVNQEDQTEEDILFEEIYSKKGLDFDKILAASTIGITLIILGILKIFLYP